MVHLDPSDAASALGGAGESGLAHPAP